MQFIKGKHNLKHRISDKTEAVRRLGQRGL